MRSCAVIMGLLPGISLELIKKFQSKGMKFIATRSWFLVNKLDGSIFKGHAQVTGELFLSGVNFLKYGRSRLGWTTHFLRKLHLQL